MNRARPGAPPCSPFSSHLPSSPLHSAQLEEARGRRGMLRSPALAWQMVRSAASARGPRPARPWRPFPHGHLALETLQPLAGRARSASADSGTRGGGSSCAEVRSD